jgi:hypothetical protein
VRRYRRAGRFGSPHAMAKGSTIKYTSCLMMLIRSISTHFFFAVGV